MPMAISVGDVIETRKPHPCGGSRWLVLRTGADIRLRCEKCGHELLLPRPSVEKSVKKLIKPKAKQDNGGN